MSNCRDLEFRTGTSDKIYIVRLYQQDAYYVVDCWYGRRMGPYKYIRKIRTGSFSTADRVYEKIVYEKISKGYKDFMPLGLDGPWKNILSQAADNAEHPERIFVSDSDCRTSSDDDRKKALERLANSGW